MSVDFTVVLRGYERLEVDELLAAADRALASRSMPFRASVRTALRGAAFTVVLRGYDRGQVDQRVRDLVAQLGDPPAYVGTDASGGEVRSEPVAADFAVVLRGYDMMQVDAALAEADSALASTSPTARALAGSVLREVAFRQRLRGYARDQVDRAVQQRLAALAGPPQRSSAPPEGSPG